MASLIELSKGDLEDAHYQNHFETVSKRMDNKYRAD